MPAVPDNEESRTSCVCAACPSKPEDDMAFYCVTSKSPAEVERGLCACSWCPVWSCYGLVGSFYCDEGPVPEDGTTGEEDLTE